MKIRKITSLTTVCLSVIGVAVASAVAEQNACLQPDIDTPTVSLNPELATLTQKIDFSYFKEPYDLYVGKALQDVFTGKPDASCQIVKAKCEVFRRAKDQSVPNPTAQVDFRIIAEVQKRSGEIMTIEGRGAEIFDARNPHQVIREAMSEAIASLKITD